MDNRYRNTFDQLHMSAACQARILAAASSAAIQEEQTTMKKPKKALKTMLLAAALATCLSAAAYAAHSVNGNQLMQLANTLNTSVESTGVEQVGNDGSYLKVNSDVLDENNLEVTSHTTTDGNGEVTIFMEIREKDAK